MTMTMLLALLLSPARAQAPADASAFRPAGCAGVSTPSGWRPFSDRWLDGAAPPGWTVLDNLDQLRPQPSTWTVLRLNVNLDYTLARTTTPVLALYGSRAAGQPERAPGDWLNPLLAQSGERGDGPLGVSGSASIAGLGSCPMGAVEAMARRACGPGVTPDCRRGELYVDCGSRDGMDVRLSAQTAGYRVLGRPTGAAADAVAQFQSFLCALRYKGPSAGK